MDSFGLVYGRVLGVGECSTDVLASINDWLSNYLILRKLWSLKRVGWLVNENLMSHVFRFDNND